MQVNEQDTVLFDVDGTLIEWLDTAFDGMGYRIENSKVLDFYGTPKAVKPIFVHVEFLKSLKKRGYYIRVHSGNGFAWAKQVVEALQLQPYVDSVETKPSKVVDDKPCSDWINPIFLGKTQ